MRKFSEYIEIIKKKGLRYSVSEGWRTIQRFHWIGDKKVLALYYENKICRYVKKYKYVLSSTAEPVNSKSGYSDIFWICWLQGIEKAPDFVKRCVESVRKHHPEKEIIIINSENINQYVNLPEYIWRKYKKGYISHTHFSDILRVALLVTHGGTWIDSSVFLSAPIQQYILDSPLFFFKASYLSKSNMKLSNWFISSEANNYVLIKMQQMLYEFWRRENYVRHYFIFHAMLSYIVANDEKAKQLWTAIPYFCNDSPHVLQFEMFNKYDEMQYKNICALSSVHKLTYKVKNRPDNSHDSYYSKILNGLL